MGWAACQTAAGWRFFIPQQPYGGMAEQTLVRAGVWLPVPDGADDVTAAAFLNPGVAAWKALVWEGELAAGAAVRRREGLGAPRRWTKGGLRTVTC